MDHGDRFERGLARNPANHQPLSPLSFLDWAAGTYPEKVGVIDGERSFTYGQFAERCRRLAGALAATSVRPGDVVSVLAPNSSALLEAHYGVPLAGAVLNALNTRLEPGTIAYVLEHAASRLMIADTELAPLAEAALASLDDPPPLVVAGGPDDAYEAFLEAAEERAITLPDEEWQALSLCYTSGTTGRPKGAVYHHRGACLNALGNALVFGLQPDSVYLWTLPMFHCNGWTYTWAVTAVGGTHVCLRKVEPKAVFEAIGRHRVTHLCGAPIVLNMLAHSPDRPKQPFGHRVRIATGGAAPPSSVIGAMEPMGFEVLHLYGLTETFGPSTVASPQSHWPNLDIDARAAAMARQGVRYPTMAEMRIGDPESCAPVPADGASLGEVLFRGNTVMKGYLGDGGATDAAFAGGWYHSGDLAVLHPDGYMEVKDRAKDVIISGGENVSSLEVEDVLYRHPAVLEAAVVARPDDTWGETVCAFVTLQSEGGATAAELVAYCRDHLAGYKVPRTVVFGELPKTSTGKIQKFELRNRARSLEPPPEA
ncbi:MAG: AMP-binding protein [Pseudomonadota bacterium]